MKKTAAVLLAMMMMMLAMCALAAPEVTAGNGGIYTYAANVLTIKAAGEYTVSNWNNGDGVPTEGWIKINSDVSGAVTLKLEDVHLDAGSNAALTWLTVSNPVDCWLTVELVDSSLEGDSGVSVFNYSGDVGVTVAGENAKITGESTGISVVIEDRTGAVHDAFVTVSASNSVIASSYNGILIRNRKGSSTVTVTAQAAGTEIKGISKNGIHATGIGDVSVTAAAENMKVTGSEYGVCAEVSVEAGNAAVTVSGKGAAVTGGKYGAYARGNDASVTVSGSGAAVSGEMNGIEAQATTGDASVTVSGDGAAVSGICIKGNDVEVTVSGDGAAVSSKNDGVQAVCNNGDLTMNVTGSAASIHGDRYSIRADASLGSAAVIITGEDASITAGSRSMFLIAGKSIDVIVKNAKKIAGKMNMFTPDGHTTVTVTDVEEISAGDYDVISLMSVSGDMTVNVKNVGRIAGGETGLSASSESGRINVNVANVQEISGGKKGIYMESKQGSSTLTLGENVTVMGSEGDAVVVLSGKENAAVKLDSENYPGIAAQLYKNETDEEPEKTLTALNAEELEAYGKVRTVHAPKAAGLPATGDDSQLALYMAMLTLAATALLAQRGLRRE